MILRKNEITPSLKIRPMTWEEFQEKRRKASEAFIAEMNKAHEEMLQRHDEIWQAFFDIGEEVPLQLKDRLRLDEEKYLQEWGINGSKPKKFVELQEKELKDWYKTQEFKRQLKEQGREENLHRL